MIDKFAVPEWMRFLTRLTGRRFGLGADTAGSPIAATPATVITLREQDDQPFADPSVIATMAKAFTAISFVQSAILESTSTQPKSDCSSPSLSAQELTSSQSPQHHLTAAATLAETADDRMTLSFLAATQTLEDRTRKLIAVTVDHGIARETVGVRSSDPAVVPAAAVEPNFTPIELAIDSTCLSPSPVTDAAGIESGGVTLPEDTLISEPIGQPPVDPRADPPEPISPEAEAIEMQESMESTSIANAAGEVVEPPTIVPGGVAAIDPATIDPQPTDSATVESALTLPDETPETSQSPDAIESLVVVEGFELNGPERTGTATEGEVLQSELPTSEKSPTADQVTSSLEAVLPEVEPDVLLSEPIAAFAVKRDDAELLARVEVEPSDPSPTLVEAGLSAEDQEIAIVHPDFVEAPLAEPTVAGADETVAAQADALPPVESSSAPDTAPAVKADDPERAAATTSLVEELSASAPAAAKVAIKSAASTVLAPAVRDEYNRTNLDYRRPMPRPKVRGKVIDFHCHLFALRHAKDWFEAADHYGMNYFVTMSPLEEAVGLAREWGHRLRFNAVPAWGDASSRWVDNWLTRIESFYNLGSRIAKFHASPGTMIMRGYRLDHPIYNPLFAELRSRKMAIMSHIGDPETWYQDRYTDMSKFGSRDDHFRMWESRLEENRGTPWVGAHMGGNPEDLPRLQRMLDRFPDLMLDCSATRWMVREISARREPAREFFIRNQDRILFGSDQVSGNDRQFDFLASRIWCHRKLWETAYTGPSPIIDPDLPPDAQPTIRGLALPDAVLQKIYHDNASRLLSRIGMGFEE